VSDAASAFSLLLKNLTAAAALITTAPAAARFLWISLSFYFFEDRKN
jgi:hypothetical protein